MKENVKSYFNVIITILLIAASVAWMVTVASQGEIVSYNRDLIINTLDIDVDVYTYNTTTLTYELYTGPTITISNMAPNDTRLFRFDITNNGNTNASTSIVFSNITGDIEALSAKMYIGSTSPTVKKLNLGESIEETNSGEKILRFFSKVTILPSETKSIYWYITIDRTATNEVADKTLEIESINFIKP